MHGLGGMEAITWDLACALAALGARISVITTMIPNLPKCFRESGVEVVALPASPGRYSASWWSASSRYLATQNPHDVAAILSVSAAGFGLLPLKHRFPATRFVMQAHGTSWDEVRSKWRGGGAKALASSLRNLTWLPRDMIAYRKFDMVVAVGEAVMAALGKPPISAVLPETKRCLIPNGIDQSLFIAASASRDQLRATHGVATAAPVFISAARLHPQKGGAQALRAFAGLAAKQPDAHYWIAGEGPEQARLQALAVELGIAGQVAFLGRLKRPDLARFLQLADVFVYLGSRIEVGLPLNILEALAAGLPVVASDHLAPPATPGIFLARPDDAAAAALRLGEAARWPVQPRRSLLPPKYDLRHCARSYLNLLVQEPQR